MNRHNYNHNTHIEVTDKMPAATAFLLGGVEGIKSRSRLALKGAMKQLEKYKVPRQVIDTLANYIEQRFPSMPEVDENQKVYTCISISNIPYVRINVSSLGGEIGQYVYVSLDEGEEKIMISREGSDSTPTTKKYKVTRNGNNRSRPYVSVPVRGLAVEPGDILVATAHQHTDIEIEAWNEPLQK